jgi:hypothetical protein
MVFIHPWVSLIRQGVTLNINIRTTAGVALLALLVSIVSLVLACHKGTPTTNKEIARCLSRFAQLSPEGQQECSEALRRYRVMQMPHVVPIAEGITAAILKMEEHDDGSAEFRISLNQLKHRFEDVHFLGGVLAFTFKGHHYRSYVLLLAPERIWTHIEGDALIIEISATPDKHRREFEGDTGKYPWKMVEDGCDCWIWDLMPAFVGEQVPDRGGPITREEMEELEQETARKLNN